MYLLYQLLFYPFSCILFIFIELLLPVHTTYTFSLLYPLLILPNFIQTFFSLFKVLL